ncbi:MAG: hypothetical protein INQ03_08220 [Candidatus Heimdallarchaeota archaeon]|nr:hypothetical protein [Candidatus Heimdallarchaeota archaeon]
MQTHYFEEAGEENREKTFELVANLAKKMPDTKIIVASTTGGNALKALEMLDQSRLIIVTHQAGFSEAFTQEMPEEIMEKIKRSDAKLLTTAHAFAGVGRAVRRKLGTWMFSELVAETYRTFGQGTKVCVEITLMAADAGLIGSEEVIAVAGTGRGADTVWTIKPAHSSDFLDLRLQKLICKPLF